MRLTSFTDFALRALMRLAGDPDRSFSTNDIAAEFGISRNHLIKVVRDLVNAQFELTDPELSSRLWQEVADRDLDRGRILHLLYSCHDLHNDDEVMRCSDEAYVALVDPRDP